MRRVAAANFSFSDRCYCGYINPIGSFYYCLTANGGANAKISSNKYLGKINYILASKIVQHFFNVSEEALSVFIGAKFNPFKDSTQFVTVQGGVCQAASGID